MRTSLLAILLLVSTDSICQYGFQNAVILTTTNDTIYCKAPIKTGFGKKFDILVEDYPEPVSILVSDIRFLATTYTLYESITFVRKNKEQRKLMQRVTTGRIDLYFELYINKGSSEPAAGGTWTSYRSPTTLYVLKKNGLTYHIPKSKFAETLKPHIQDLPELASKLGKRNYRYEDLEKIIKEYNKEFGG